MSLRIDGVGVAGERLADELAKLSKPSREQLIESTAKLLGYQLMELSRRNYYYETVIIRPDGTKLAGGGRGLRLSHLVVLEDMKKNHGIFLDAHIKVMGEKL